MSILKLVVAGVCGVLASGCLAPPEVGVATSAVTGTFAITFDATAVSAGRFNIPSTTLNGPNVVTSIELAPDAYNFCVPTSNNCFEFVVTAAGTLDFASTLDSYVHGRGTTTLVVTGSPIAFDATAVSAGSFNIDFGDIGTGANVPTTYQLIPGVYRYCVPASNNCFLFAVTAAMTLDFDPTLDGYVHGRGTTMLVVTGDPITVDATAVAAADFNIDFGDVASGPNVPTTLALVPGTYRMCVPASNDCFLFDVTAAGRVDFDASLDGRLAGRGTTTLVVGGLAPTVTCVGSTSAPAVVAVAPTSCSATIAAPQAGSCAAPATCTFDGLATEQLGLGTHTVAVVATAATGQVASCASVVAVVDQTAPAVSLAPSPSVLWPPDHKLMPIALHLAATDNCNVVGTPSCTVTSSDPGAAADIVWHGATLLLRAERSGAHARTYTITCTARDGSGNLGTRTATVTVPRSHETSEEDDED